MTRGSVARRLWLWAPPVAYLALIFYLSGRPQNRWAASYPDVLLHAAEYCGLAVLLARALNRGLLRRMTAGRLALTWVSCVVYAASDEIHQYFVPGRVADYRDVIADAAGAALGLLGFLLLQRLPGMASGDPLVRAVLYSRAGCAPCFAMKRAAGRAARRTGVSLAIVDVDSDPTLLRLHGDHVPVLELPGGRLLRQGSSAFDLDQAFLEAARSARPGPVGPKERDARGGVARAVDRLRRLLGADA